MPRWLQLTRRLQLKRWRVKAAARPFIERKKQLVPIAPSDHSIASPRFAGPTAWLAGASPPELNRFNSMPDSHRPFEGQPSSPDPAPHLRARVPDHVANGSFSTGAIVVTGPTEFIIDFLQTIGRPHRVTARVIIPHPVMPQFIDALGQNLAIYTDRFGPPAMPLGVAGPASAPSATARPQVLPKQPADPAAAGQPPEASAEAAADTSPGHDGSHPDQPAAEASGQQASGSGAAPSTSDPSASGLAGQRQPPNDSLESAFGSTDVFPGAPQPPPMGHQPPPPPRRPTPQEIYDDLKIPDAILSGAYANGVMIGHGPSEFCLDFLTSFYPQSAVSSRVFVASSQVPRLLESLHHAYQQLSHMRQQPPPRPPQDRDPGTP